MKKNLLLVCLSCLLALSIATSAMASSVYQDMPDDYSTTALSAAVSNGLLNGDNGKIMPNDNLTRAQMAAIIVRAFGATKEASLAGYKDVPKDSWYYSYMGKAVQMKTFNGYDSKLNPDGFITRQEAFTVIARALELKDGAASDISPFSDSKMVASWAIGTTAAMVKNGFIHGSDGKINPTEKITRKDFAVMMDNIIKNYIVKEGTYTEIATGSVMINVPNVTLKNVTIKGNLIIGDGVGEGNVTLDNVKVEGATIVRGGGTHSFIVKGTSSLGAVIISKVDGNVRVSVEDNAKVEIIEVQDGKDDVIVEGTVAKLVVDSSDTPVVVQNAKVGEVKVTAANAEVTVASTATVTTVTTEAIDTTLTVNGTVTTVNTTANATGAKVEVCKGAAVGTINVSAAKTEIKGEGRVENANISANNVKIDTAGTQTKVDNGITGTTTDGKDIAGGTTSETDGTLPSQPGAGGSTGGGGSVSPARKDIKVTAENFNVNIGGDYSGVNVGWNFAGAGLSSIKSIKVELFSGATLLNSNISSPARLTDFQKAGQFSTPFILSEGTYTMAADDYWSFGTWSAYTKPTKAVITVTDINGYAYVAENSTLTNDGDGDTWESIFADVKTSDELSSALKGKASLITVSGNIDSKVTVNRAVALHGGKTATLSGGVEITAQTSGSIILDGFNITKAMTVNATQPGKVIIKNNNLTMADSNAYGINAGHYYIVNFITSSDATDIANGTAFNIEMDNNTVGSPVKIETAPSGTVAFLMNTQPDSNFPHDGSTFKFTNNKIYLNSLHVLYNTKASTFTVDNNTFKSDGKASASGTETTALTAYNGGKHGKTTVTNNTFAGLGYAVKCTQYDGIPAIELGSNTFDESKRLNAYYALTTEGLKIGLSHNVDVVRVLGTNGKLTLTESVEVPAGKTLEIPKNKNLFIPNGFTVTNNGTIVNNGLVVLDGTLEVAGTVTNNAYIDTIGTIVFKETGVINNTNNNSGVLTTKAMVDLENNVQGLLCKVNDSTYILSLTNKKDSGGNVLPVKSGVPLSGSGEALENVFFNSNATEGLKTQTELNASLAAKSITNYTAIAFDFTKFEKLFGKDVVADETNYHVLQANSPYLEVYNIDKVDTDSATNTDQIFKVTEEGKAIWCKRMSSDFANGSTGAKINGIDGLALLTSPGDKTVIQFSSAAEKKYINIVIVNNLVFSNT